MQDFSDISAVKSTAWLPADLGSILRTHMAPHNGCISNSRVFGTVIDIHAGKTPMHIELKINNF